MCRRNRLHTLKSQMKMSLRMIKRKNESLCERLSGGASDIPKNHHNNNINNNNNNNNIDIDPKIVRSGRQQCWSPQNATSADCCECSVSSGRAAARTDQTADPVATSGRNLLKCFASPCAHFSVKFGRKVQYVNYLHELEPHMDLTRLPIPKQVIE